MAVRLHAYLYDSSLFLHLFRYLCCLIVFWDVLEDVSQKVLLSPELRVILTEDRS